MKNLRYYICEYCVKEFEPQRRGVQKYCSNSCRSKAYHARQKLKINQRSTDLTLNGPITGNQSTPEKMSIAGVGNAAAGTLAVDLVKNLLTKESSKPATKGDIKALIGKLQGRYHLVKNMPIDKFGRYAYFDMTNNVVVYL